MTCHFLWLKPPTRYSSIFLEQKIEEKTTFSKDAFGILDLPLRPKIRVTTRISTIFRIGVPWDRLQLPLLRSGGVFSFRTAGE